ncbi:MAG: DUF1015 domain-containing protein [Acidobacteria bacterium]|nr:DUF1015 domain-containing protein [Acidobacteriota bacterium]
MALIYPFRGFRFNPEKAGDWDLLVTQPYDKITPELQEDYYRRSPFNIVRITKNAEKDSDNRTEYPDAAATLERWIADGILVRDPAPSIYAYYRQYEFEGEELTQKGFIALLGLGHGAGGILPHEHTLSEPKADRLRLMRATESNDDLIYTLYTDDRFIVDRVLDEPTHAAPPDIVARDDYGAAHRLWAISERRFLKRIQDAMIPEELFIADGHHRFETSVAYMNECRSRGWKAAAVESFDKRLVACFNSAGEGITILPTHRLIHSLATLDVRRFVGEAAQYFFIEEVGSPEEMWQRMKQGRGRAHVFGFYAAALRMPCVLTLREESKVDPLMLAHSEAYRQLDVSILHTLLLDRLLGIDAAKLASQANVEYAREKEACIRGVDEGNYQAAFFLNPTTVEQMQRVALLGERMPQKSTDFYPKLPTGLVLMKMCISRP